MLHQTDPDLSTVCRTERCVTRWTTSWVDRGQIPTCQQSATHRLSTGNMDFITFQNADTCLSPNADGMVCKQLIFLSLVTGSKPIKPSTLSNKPLPFIKVIEIKSWSSCAEERLGYGVKGLEPPDLFRLKPNSSSTIITTTARENVCDVRAQLPPHPTTNTPEGNSVESGSINTHTHIHTHTRVKWISVHLFWMSVCKLYYRCIMCADTPI